jgi:hypothetical protein
MADNDETPRPFSSFLRPRLAWHTDAPVPTLDELGLDDARRAAFRWQSIRNNAEFFGFFWHGEVTGGYVREVFGLFGSSGELVLSSLAAAVEIEVTRRALFENDELDEVNRRLNHAAQWRSLRFFGEAQANNLMIFGHGVANLILRTLALQPEFKAARVRRISVDAFHPESDEPRAWCSFTRKTAGEMRSAASDGPVDAGPILDSLDELWDVLGPLWSVRGMQYHRWRGESPGVTGINFQNPNPPIEQEGLITRTMRLANDYVEGERIVNDVVSTADAALKKVGAWMPVFLDVWSPFFNECKRHNESVAEEAWRGSQSKETSR